MTNMISVAKTQIQSLLLDSLKKIDTENLIEDYSSFSIPVEIPKDTNNGDFSSSLALVCSKLFKTSPYVIAKKLVSSLSLDSSYFSSVTIAGPGFINFTLASNWYSDSLTLIQTTGEKYGMNADGVGKKVMVEFVSANPTGPMHIGNARGGVLGDTLSNILSFNGYDSYKEFYMNDAGNQVHKFAISINARYYQLILGESNYEFPKECYQGDDIRELASNLYHKYGDSLISMDEDERLALMASYGLGVNIPKIKEDLLRYRIDYDNWFFESSLYESGYIDDTINRLIDSGYTYTKDGALWLKTAELLRKKYCKAGKTEEQIERLNLKDDVLKRSNGFYTYFAADIAYHRNKFEKRKFDKVINVWGADHAGHVARLQVALDVLGLDGSNRLIIVLMQLVNLLKDGKPFRMSKRSGKALSLCDLLDEISVDAARYFFNCRSASSTLDFDLDLAIRTDSENPVYYIQYAYARIYSLFSTLLQENEALSSFSSANLSLLTSETEKELIKLLAKYPDEIKLSALEYDPSYINKYLLSLAGAFHRFYTTNRIKGTPLDIQLARLLLVDSTRIVLKSGMNILGITTPIKM